MRRKENSKKEKRKQGVDGEQRRGKRGTRGRHVWVRGEGRQEDNGLGGELNGEAVGEGRARQYATWADVSFTNAQWPRYSQCHFTGKETKSQTGEGTCPKSHS